MNFATTLIQEAPLTPEQLGQLVAVIAGALISLAATYIPGFNARFAAMAPEWKPLAMMGFNILAAGLIFGASCAGLAFWMVCSAEGLNSFWVLLVNMLIGNQVAFLLSPKPAAVLAAKARR